MTESNTEVTQGSKERLDVLELDRTPRDEKLARETAMLQGASEVHYTERAFRPRHPATLDDVRAHVDALEPKRLPLPEPVPLPPAHDAPSPLVSEAHLRALEPVVDGAIVRVERVYRADLGEVVDVTLDRHGAQRVATYLIEDGVARPMADVHDAVDALPAPRGPPAPAPEAPSPPPAAAPMTATDEPRKEKMSRFKLPFGKKETPTETTAAEEKPADDTATKSRFSFRRK